MRPEERRSSSVSFIRTGELRPPSSTFLLSTCAQRWHSNAGGGGERVLWTAIALMQRTEPDVISVVYSGDIDATKEQIVAKVKVRTDSWRALLLLTFAPSRKGTV